MILYDKVTKNEQSDKIIDKQGLTYVTPKQWERGRKNLHLSK